jgi:DinB family protein
MTTTLADRTEAAEYYFTYIDKVPRDKDVRRVLEDQLGETVQLLSGISEDKSHYRYAPEKWSIREVVGHLSDCERLFVFRAMWFARGFDSPLPSFDQNVAIVGARSEDYSLKELVEEFRAVRGSTLHFFRNLPDEAWTRRGIASGNPFTVRALAHIAAGHVAHHVGILRERYL